jgi:signal transduction histidine kinase
VSTSKRLSLFVLATGAVLGLLAESIAFDWTELHLWIPDILVGWLFIGCGVVAMARLPNSRAGLLMELTGFTWFLGNFAGMESGIVAWAAAQGVYFHRGPLIHLILTYPSGRIPSRPVLATVGIGYAAAVLPSAWSSEVATLVLTALVLGIATREYSKAIGRSRRARLLTLYAAIGLGLALVGGSAARFALSAGDASYPALVAYQAMLCTIVGGLLAGVMTTFWERADIADLVVELGGDRAGTLRDALARTLGDPSLEVAYWFADAGSFVDSEGRVFSLPDPASKRSVTLVEREDQPIAAIVHDPAVLDDPELLEAVRSAAQLSASNARLQAEVRARVVELEASGRRILLARDEERRRLERRLHDGAERRLDELRETLRRVRLSAASPQTNERIIHAEAQLSRTLEELRHLGQGLHPRILSEQGLRSAITSLAEGSPIPVEINVTKAPMPPSVEVAAYFTCAEALANVAKYASASNVTVSVTSNEAGVMVVIEDDGVGGADPANGSGLRGLADRIGTLGGTLRVDSVPGHGTRLAAEIPLDGETV